VGVACKLCHYWYMRHILLLTLSLVLVSGCSSNQRQQQSPGTAAQVTAPVAPPVSGDVAPVPLPEPKLVPERHIPDDSLYPLLVAELALRRRNYDLALENYMVQADLLRDRGVSAHTTRLAQFMHRDEEAITASQLWVELDPDNLEAQLTLANLLARQGRAREALPHMESILRAGGLANFTALIRGFQSLDDQAREELLEAIKSLLAEYPDNIQLRISLTLMLEELGQPELALSELQPVFDLDPGQLQAIVLDAKLRLDLGQTKNIYARIEAALEEQPANMRLRMQYARLLTRTDLALAEQQFSILLEQEPDDADLLFSLALIQRERANLDGARSNLERLLELNLRTDEAQYYLGKTAEDQERWADALTHYMQVQPGRDFGAATDRIARLLLASGRSAELAAWFDHLRLRYPQLGERLFAMEADKFIGSKHLAEAMELLNRALIKFPDSVPLLYSRSMLNEQQGNLAPAEEDLRAIIALDPDNSTALNALGYTLANRTNRYAEAAELIGRALTIDPQEPAILDSMGWVSYRLGDYETALRYLQQAYAAFPDPEVAAHLGEVLWSSGDQDAARAVWKQALADSPEHAIVLETMHRFGVDPATD
jgi:tetratricopeptide (TPR) repeat protein